MSDPTSKQNGVALEVRDLRARYGRVEALHGVSLTVHENEIVALVGPNGAGKTTVLRAVSGELRTFGEVWFLGSSLTRRRPHAIAKLGVGHLPEGRGTFVDLTVAENLKLACISTRRARAVSVLDEAYDLFPELVRFRSTPAGSLSGGQQQMLAIGRAILARPKLLLIDEPCVGLAPKTSADVFDRLRRMIAEAEISVLLAEQNLTRAFDVAARAYALSSGRVVASGEVDSLRSDDAVRAAYLGRSADGQAKSSAEGDSQ